MLSPTIRHVDFREIILEILTYISIYAVEQTNNPSLDVLLKNFDETFEDKEVVKNLISIFCFLDFNFTSR